MIDIDSDDDLKKIVPYIPFYKQAGCKVVRDWETYFVDRNGNEAILTHIEYLDKKQKPHEVIIKVRWK